MSRRLTKRERRRLGPGSPEEWPASAAAAPTARPTYLVDDEVVFSVSQRGAIVPHELDKR